MDAAVSDLSANPLAVSIISLIVGSSLTLLLTSLKNKSGVIGYTITWRQIGMSADDNVFGEVRVTWQNHQLRNLYFYSIDAENMSSIDYENVELRVFTGGDTIILNERTSQVGTPNIVAWSPDFRSLIHVPEGAEVTEDQSNEYNVNRKYLVPVLNRRQKLNFSYLCTNPNDDDDPGIFLDTQTKGLRLKLLKPPFVVLNPLWGVPIPVALARALILAIAVVVLIGLFVSDVWVAALIAMIFGLTGQVFGAVAFRVERFVHDIFTR